MKALSIRIARPIDIKLLPANFLGVFAALVTTCIWAIWLIATKAGVESSIATADMALIRYGVPVLVFSIFTIRSFEKIRSKNWIHLLGICLGAGVPFFFLGAQGMQHAPVSHAGILIPGTFPLFVTAIAVIVYREKLKKQTAVGLGFICLGIIALLASSWMHSDLQTLHLKGYAYFLAASFCWACYTVCMRVSAVPGIIASALFGFVSLVLLVFLGAFDLVESKILSDEFSSHFLQYSETYISQLFIQGVLVGVVAGISYGYAVHHLGAENTTAIGSLTPVIAAIAATFIFDETITFLIGIATVAVVLGVLIRAGTFSSSHVKRLFR